jgi:hypothetical protein
VPKQVVIWDTTYFGTADGSCINASALNFVSPAEAVAACGDYSTGPRVLEAQSFIYKSGDGRNDTIDSVAT